MRTSVHNSRFSCVFFVFFKYEHQHLFIAAKLYDALRVLCNLQSHSLQAASLHKDRHGAGEPYDVDQLVLLFLCKLWLLDFGF